ncbi:unnamed protein product [Blepharisma stoltei]|uniref:DNA helicase n=1 Tax=Blepharisma stoltei TaxID=1481888 RepID=A0AAU9K890_9CILI|nr:unnamed protein product [Blepharisma stoltei]
MEINDRVLGLYFQSELMPEEMNAIKLLVSFFDDPEIFTKYFQFKNTNPYPNEFNLNYSKILADSTRSIELTEVLQTLRYKPDVFLPTIHAAVHQIFFKHYPQVPIQNPIRIFITKYDVITLLSNIRSAMIQRFVCISGSVVKMSPRKPYVIGMDFLCLKCSAHVPTTFPEGKYTLPMLCSNQDCRNIKAFQPLRDTAKLVNWQRIKVQECSSDDQIGVPLTMECEAKNLDISHISVGDPVTIMGIVRAESSDVHKIKNTGLYGLYLEIVTVVTNKDNECEVEDLTSEEIARIKEMAKSKNIFHSLVKNFCGVIYGLEKVKAGLLLSLLGGNDMQSRGTSHVLVIGEPGLGKTQLIKTALGYSPRGIYISAATKTGLTVSIAKENGQQSMRAGGLVMADEGICAIDEFDKMGKEQESLLEVMEEQTMTIAKSGIYCNLRVRATVIAAANPVQGHYNPSRTLSENLKINAAVLSRFDLVFLLLENHEAQISRHVINIHSGVKRNFDPGFRNFEMPPPPSVRRLWTQSSTTSQRSVNDVPLETESFTGYMKRVSQELQTNISHDIIKKYINYARKHIHPRLSQGAIDLLNAFFSKLRKDSPGNGIPVTSRQLESLKRLAEARAKAELREIASEIDAMEVIKLYQETIYDFKTQDFVMPRMTRKRGTDRPLGELSVAKQQLVFLDKIREEIESRGDDAFSFQELLTLSKDLGMRVGDFGFFIERLNQSNLLLKKPGGMYKVLQSAL